MPNTAGLHDSTVNSIQGKADSLEYLAPVSVLQIYFGPLFCVFITVKWITNTNNSTNIHQNRNFLGSVVHPDPELFASLDPDPEYNQYFLQR